MRSPAHATGDVLAGVPWLAGLPRASLDTLAVTCPLRELKIGARLLSELEPGEEAFVLLEGRGRVTVGGWGDDPPVEIGHVGPGDCVGEMALFTDELRSATVIAETPLRALVLDRARFVELMQRHPAIGAHLAQVLAARLRETEQVLAAVLDPKRSDAERRAALRGSATSAPGQHRLAVALHVAWRELVASHRRELPFLMLLSFIGALTLVRSAIRIFLALSPGGTDLEALLRASYILGLFLIAGSGTASLLLFRPGTRRFLATLFGAGMALLFNSLSVLLTFDLFYRDIFTPDPSMQFSVEVLYERAEGAHVAIVTAALLLQAVYLRNFYRRVFTLVSMRWLRSRA